MKYLSFDVGIKNMAYCLMEINNNINNKYNIICWENININNSYDKLCECGKIGLYSNIIDDNIIYYCLEHKKKFEVIEYNIINNSDFVDNYKKIISSEKCNYNFKYNNKFCNKKVQYEHNNILLCNSHAKQHYKNLNNNRKIKKIKNDKLNYSNTIENLIRILDNKKELLQADIIIIENQPSFKNPTMKSISNSIYNYYLIRGIIDKNINNSNIQEVRFFSPINKLKLIKNKNNIVDKNINYKCLKRLSVEYCYDFLICECLNEWHIFLSRSKKKDDLSDCLLQILCLCK